MYTFSDTIMRLELEVSLILTYCPKYLPPKLDPLDFTSNQQKY